MKWLCGLATALLAACGGGGDASSAPPTEPSITSFAAGKAAYLMGERAQLIPQFVGGSGRIEPDIGPVQSGVAVGTPVLEGDVTYRLIVEAAGQPSVTRTLSLPVNHRDRYVAAGSFESRYHAAIELPDGSVLIVGGSRGGSVSSDSIDRYDPVTRTFTPVASMATGRVMARLVVLADGNVLIVGGGTNIAGGVTYELFDVAAGRVMPAGLPVRNRLGHTATRLADGRVLIAGGLQDNTAELWDPATRSARPIAAHMANAREWHTATLLADGRVLLVGGFSMVSPYWLAELFDPRTEQFTPIGAPRFAPQVDVLALHAAHRLADGTVLIAGGELFNPVLDQGGRPTANVLKFDPVTLQFAPLPALLMARTLMTTAALPDRLVILGGLDSNIDATPTGEVYRVDGARLSTQSLATGRAYHTVSRLPGGRLLIVGGESPNGAAVSDALIYE